MAPNGKSKIMNPALDENFHTASLWHDEAIALREILSDCDLAEELKWGKPCYTHHGANVAIIQRMKDFLALMFFKGAALEDLDGILVEQGPNSRFAKRLEFTSVKAVQDKRRFIEAYIEEAIQLEKTGTKVDVSSELHLIDELQEKLAEDPEFSAAFDALTPGRQRGYNLHFGGAKQPATRIARINKYRQKIMDGKGFNDR